MDYQVFDNSGTYTLTFQGNNDIYVIDFIDAARGCTSAGCHRLTSSTRSSKSLCFPIVIACIISHRKFTGLDHSAWCLSDRGRQLLGEVFLALLLLLLGNSEQNPGPVPSPTSLNLASFNVCSALIHSIVADALLTFKSLHTIAPSYLLALIHLYVLLRVLCSSNAHQLCIPHISIEFGSHGFRSAGPTLWNSLPLSVTSCSIILTSRKQLKTLKT